jgi:signal transduction histidine kinase
MKTKYFFMEFADDKLLILFFTIASCLLLAFLVNFVLGIQTIYTQLFYIPILLAGIWYQKEAVYVAIFIGALHLITTYTALGYFVTGTFERYAIFIVVAYVIGYVSTKYAEGKKELKNLLKELEAKNNELERFTYTISHDLRSPLSAIMGYASLLRKNLEASKAEKAERDLKQIEKGVTMMDHLLTDTLALSRIGRVANPPEDTSFGEIVQEALEQTTEQIKSSGVEVSVADDFPTVHVDRMRIAEVLVNLITNSINYMGQQPHPKMNIGYHVDSEETVFFVKDNGIGIDKSHHEKVFELFYKTDKNSKGTGAGLAIVKRIIEVHGGRIWIESEKGKGCTVYFTLPVV